MARPSDKERVKLWQTRVNRADKAYKDWAEKFKTDRLEEYWEGMQWDAESLKKGAYVINLCFPAVEIKIPSLLYYRPKVTISPRPARADDQMSDIQNRAKLQEDTLATVLNDPNLNFLNQHEFGIRDSMFRFAVVEVGYTSSWLDNPRAGKPILIDGVEAQEEAKDSDGNVQVEPDRVLSSEQLYLKWIPAKQFRVSFPAKNILEENDWCGYYEYHYPDDLVRNKQLSNTSGIKTTHKIQTAGEVTTDDPEVEKQKEMVKVWKIWDMRTKTRLIFLDSGEKFLYEKKYKTLPFSDCIFLPRLGQYYPLPVTYNWISIQDELNETRQMQRIHRKRFTRRYTYVTGQIEPDSLVKLESGGDGVYAEAAVKEPLTPVPDAPLDPAIARNIPQSKQDFMEVSGSTAEQRGVAESETATQANIIDVRSQIRESFGRVKVANWIAKTCRIILQTIIDNMQLKMWILANVDPLGPGAAVEAAKVANAWKEIKASQLGAQVFDVVVDVESLSPMSSDAKRQQWEKVLSLIIASPTLALSDVLLKKTLAFYDIKDDRDIQEIKKAMLAMMMMAQQAAQAKSGSGSGPSPMNRPPAIDHGAALQ